MISKSSFQTTIPLEVTYLPGRRFCSMAIACLEWTIQCWRTYIHIMFSNRTQVTILPSIEIAIPQFLLWKTFNFKHRMFAWLRRFIHFIVFRCVSEYFMRPKCWDLLSWTAREWKSVVSIGCWCMSSVVLKLWLG